VLLGEGEAVEVPQDALEQDFIVVATPLGNTDTVLRELAMRRPRGVIFDVGSLKSPLRGGLMALKSHGCRVTSVHPMFGPDTELLSGRHVIFVDLGHEEALGKARELFAPTMVEQVVMTLDEHDRLIAYVLGLSHALNIAFFTALADSGEAAPRLARLSSTTFDAQLDVATRVAQESPQLYFEIQALNDYGAESLEALAKAVEMLRRSVLSRDAAGFTALMERGREYLEDRKSLTARRA
jgi:chorismate mutase/prephenate dehydrogenase